MRNSITKACQWILLSLNLFKISIGPSLFIAMTYLLIYLIVPAMPSTQFLTPFTILVWPFITVFILYFYFCVSTNKVFEISDGLKVISKNPRGLFLMTIASTAYAMLMGFLVSGDIENILLILQKPEVRQFQANHFLYLLLKLTLLGVPFYMAAWFSPLLIACHNYGFIKALKSSFAGALMYIMPLFFSWVGLTVIFIGLVMLITFLLTSLTFISMTMVSFFTSLLLLLLLASFVAIMFCLQFISFIAIFKKFSC
ncbi:MAG: hypothetical protein HQ470_01655 [Methylophilales bacterium]|jgi:hypothetical protein|nr:hypothetical protein [Pseudomonadota bacterium]NQW34495.1 hypothetical protein [Methylophilales bacterium]HCK04176.1 hypothetical protein [Methylophilaceae bacterium]|tara:strand:- start:19128 stop:19892 length:765 start_codon:yes stop_codon:yes gene_type:complete